MKKIPIMLFLGLILSLPLGCTPPEIRSSTPEVVVIENVYTRDSPAAHGLAEAHCRQYRKEAVLIPGQDPDGVLAFYCVIPE